MAGPPFRLARVLRLRTQLRERAREEVARERAALARAHEEIAAVRAAREAALAAEAAAAATGMTGADLHRSRAWTGALAVEEAALGRKATALAAQLERLREALRVRRREERQLERLRERAWERSQAAEERTAAALLDDLARRRKA
jgi:flagellar export protein FliJ